MLRGRTPRVLATAQEGTRTVLQEVTHGRRSLGRLEADEVQEVQDQVETVVLVAVAQEEILQMGPWSST